MSHVLIKQYLQPLQCLTQTGPSMSRSRTPERFGAALALEQPAPNIPDSFLFSLLQVRQHASLDRKAKQKVIQLRQEHF